MKDMTKEIKSRLIDKLWGRGSLEINFDKDENRRAMQAVEKYLFKPGEIANDGLSSFSVLVRRALAQYLGQRHWVKPSIMAIRNMLSAAVLSFFIVFMFCKGLFGYRLRGGVSGEGTAAIMQAGFYKYFLDDIFPDGYKAVSGRDMVLKPGDIGFIIDIIRVSPRYLWNPDLLFRSIVKISQYSYIVLKYNPRVICNFAEGSFWSSLMTAYCRKHGIQHVNVMHGVRFYSSCNAFAEFDEFYVWGEYHAEQFRMMNVSARNFIIRGNPIHRELRELAAGRQDKKERTLVIMLEYYLLANKDLLPVIGDIFGKLGSGWKIVCRLCYGERSRQIGFINELQKRFGRNVAVEDPEKTSIINSIGNADLVAGFYTNALSDAWIGGKKCLKLHSGSNNKLPLQEYHKSRNIKVFSRGSDIADFLSSPLCEDAEEIQLKNRFSKIHEGAGGRQLC